MLLVTYGFVAYILVGIGLFHAKDEIGGWPGLLLWPLTLIAGLLYCLGDVVWTGVTEN